ncbi:hypothetical protein L249_6703 [Ophiocordyceps polyrhachis-furcata BCC 54312]|uniref:Protein kinase domain-containing protein n=1 Tax=Ophiocordyceps polyrhachis-furcata BCC 54312 TaxID=1330021 RepID=A0A367LK69_9HYPO|nr:hypothetical protein L249_6703 [Ophiocordyceps polyrhachis-furcata BCC 54312]
MNSTMSPMAGFQLSFHRRLTRLYSDTKKSTDFVREPLRHDGNDPDIKTLQRKMRIQKDRLVSWGLEWSDSAQSTDIDHALSRAGLSDVVASIMSTIKDILAEAEALWLASECLVGQPRSSIDKKPPLVRWDKARFEDLVRDLTVSIETLYDLSRSRSRTAMPRCMSAIGYKAAAAAAAAADDPRLFGSSRVQTPRHIDPCSLTRLMPLAPIDDEPPRHVVLLVEAPCSDLARGSVNDPQAPLLLEYAAFDPIYANTGIMPDMARFERLSAGLQQDPQCAVGSWIGLPRLMGYFEDMDNARLGLLYRFPPHFHVLSSDSISESTPYNLFTLGDLLLRPHSEPPLEAKLRLAFNLANTIFDMHGRGITHGKLDDRNILFPPDTSGEHRAACESVDVRCPLVSAFDLFPDDSAANSPSLWRHSGSIRSSRVSPLDKLTEERVLDLYSLAMALLSIGLWVKLDTLASDLESPDCLLRRLAVKCGGLFVKATQACWHVVDADASGSNSSQALFSAVEVRVSGYLETCCALDSVSGLEWRLSLELKRDGLEKRKASEKANEARACAPNTSAASDRRRALTAPEPVTTRQSGSVDAAECRSHDNLGGQETADKSETRIRLYPHVPLAPDVVERWNTSLMPQINHALRHFYRKHPESVEVSLGSVGPSPSKAQPTALIVCTSVSKVRAILKKRFVELFDGSIGIGVRVCRGHVIRSRRQAKLVTAPVAPTHRSGSDPGCGSMSDDGEDAAVNPDYQERPGNGASIGAWIGYRHLPPVSFGGLVMVDGQPYGMTVHHMVDEPDRELRPHDILRSSTAADPRRYSNFADEVGATDDDFAQGLSEAEPEPCSDSDVTSDYGEDDSEADDEFEPGDIPGIEPGCGDGYLVTQPALDDVGDDFYPCAETKNEDHNDSFHLGRVFASSGIRRKQVNGLVHEVDWALFRFSDGRLPDDNRIPRAMDRRWSSDHGEAAHLRPTSVAPSSSLPGMEVQCVARTSGIQTGQILPALTTVKIYGRTSPSHAYEIASSREFAEEGAHRSLGIPGDSGAWVVDRRSGQLCGHIVAWSQRKRVAYICPMDVLLLDVAQTVDATEVKLPGGEPLQVVSDTGMKNRCEEHVHAAQMMMHPSTSMPRLHMNQQDASKLVVGLGQTSEFEGLANKMDDLSISKCRRIGVT